MEDAPKLLPIDRERKHLQTSTVIPAPSVLPWDQVPRDPHLLDYLIILRKHQWLIATFLLTVVTVVTIASFKMKPVYQATARVEVDREGQSLSPFQDANSYDAYVDSENYIETQTKILQSETVALATIRSLNLARYPEFGGDPKSGGRPRDSASGTRPPILAAFLGRLTVKRVPNSRLIDVGFEAQNAELAAQVVNTHLHNYVEQNFRSKYDATTQASTWLSAELEELRIKVERSEDARIGYERENQIWQIDEKQDITTQKLSDLSKAVTEAETELAQKEALYKIATSGNVDALPAVQNNVVIQDLMKRKADLDEQLNEAINQYGPKFPKVERMVEQQKEINDSLAQARQTIVESVREEYDTSRSRVDILERNLDEQKAEANDLAEKLVQYHILQHDAESNKQLYDGLLQKLKEAGISAGLRSDNIHVVDPALVPSSPSRPQKARNILLAFLVGIVGGIGLALFREYLDDTVKSPDDIEMLTGLPSLAVVPALPGIGIAHSRVSRTSKTAPPGAQGPRIEMLSFLQPKSQISEAFRALRTSLLLSQADHPPQVILVTSALPREGKTTAAVNLAVTLAQLGDRTLLIDSDLRKPGIRRALGITTGKEAGLSSYLAGVSTLDEVTVPHPSIQNLVAMTTGPVPPSPADLLSSHRMREAIAELRHQFKFIVVDSPPVMAATDAVLISALTDGVLLVVRSGETPKEAFTRTRDLLAAVKCRLLGVVLNAVDSSAPDYYYSYRYYPYAYGYGYGEDVGKTPKSTPGPDEPAGPGR
jgi:capsular exopolysaccharide synthesis family protein